MSAHVSHNPLTATRRNTQALEAERAQDALAAMQALQRKMRERVMAQPTWRLPEPKRRA
jgi:hypothetical protein